VPVLPFRLTSRSSVSSGGQGERSQRRKAGASGSRSATNGASGRSRPTDTGPQERELRAAPVPAFGAPDQASRARRSSDHGPSSRGAAGDTAATVSRATDPLPRPQAAAPAGVAVFGTDGHLLAISQERRELVCSVIGLMVKLGLVAVAGVSLVRLAGAYQQRMDRNGEIVAVLELEKARLARARDRFDELFMVAGEQRLIREQSQWIAPNRLRVVWQTPPSPLPPSSNHP
jgi:hypothetical protein